MQIQNKDANKEEPNNSSINNILKSSDSKIRLAIQAVENLDARIEKDKEKKVR